MLSSSSDRAGQFIPQKGGYSSFVPRLLPPQDNLDIDEGLQLLMSSADVALARLDGVTHVLPNPDLFVAMYVKKEALLSSQIEGTQASLQGVLEFEANADLQENFNDIQEVINYIKSMNDGLEKVKTSKISVDLINEIHSTLIKGTRGERRLPGTLRSEQNWVGLTGQSILEAKFVPPPPEMVQSLMKNLEEFIQQKDKFTPLIKIALIHAQFETIHPYYDGNGRMGRLLITFYLCSVNRLSRPLLYLSFYLKKNKSVYYDLLNNIRTNGDWESWIQFFLKGVIEVSDNAIDTAKRIIKLKEDTINKLLDDNEGGKNAIRLVNSLFTRPFVSTTTVSEDLEVSMQTATKLIKKFEELEILAEYTGKQRYKRYYFIDYIKIIEEGTKLK
jgi:Fic family protein